MIKPIQWAPAGLLICALCASPAGAQDLNAIVGGAGGANAPATPTATVSRAADGAVTVRAVRIAEPPRIDGHLDERLYSDVLPIDGFIQQDPREGESATENTDAWIFFDSKNIYVSVRCWDSHPEREIANEMRRDGQAVSQNDNITVIFDTFHDGRNGMFFQTTVLGAQRDALITDENALNQDWNAVWDVKTQRFDQGWTAEFAIPFRSLRYNADPVQVWRVNFRRNIRWKNETSYVTSIPAYLGQRGAWMVSLGATLVGLETPPKGANLDLKPYGIQDRRTDLRATKPFTNQWDHHFGADAKVRHYQRPDARSDLQHRFRAGGRRYAAGQPHAVQPAISRTARILPRRPGHFFVWRSAEPGWRWRWRWRWGWWRRWWWTDSNANTPVLFFSRRIGLNNGRPIPIAGGGRLTGRVGATSVGLLNIRARDDFSNPASPTRATSFTVARLKRDVLQRSNVGVLYTRRAEIGADGSLPGSTFGADGLYSFSTSLNFNGYYARTTIQHVKQRHNDSYLGAVDYNADRYGLQLQRIKVDENFNPQAGFLRRTDFVRSFAQARFSPRPARDHMKAVRRFIFLANLEYIEKPKNEEIPKNRLDWREQEGQFEIELQNSDRVTFDYTRDYEYIPDPFEISPGVTVPTGGYTYNNLLASYSLGSQHRVSGGVSFQIGQLYGGTKRSLGFSGGRIELSSHLALEPSVSVNRVNLPWGRFTTTVATKRTTYMISPRMFVSALVQYNSSSDTLSTNARFRWEYQSASELFVVFSDGRDTTLKGFPALMNRALIVKITKLIRL